MRRQRFDPQVIRERRQLSNRRRDLLVSEGIIEKPKGVDISLAVRVLEDAYRGIFNICYSFTSDIDFLPVIRVLQRLGKKVLVFGYEDGLASQSELAFVPDAFVDLGAHMRNCYTTE